MIENLTADLIRSKVPVVTEAPEARLLVQSPDYTGFATVKKNGNNPLRFPHGQDPRLSHIQDLRLFGEKGEWHVWQQWDGKWRERLKKFDSQNTNFISRDHFLWGTAVERSSGSAILTEDRGIKVQFPDALDSQEPPFLLRIHEYFEADPATGLMGIVDAAIEAFAPAPQSAGRPE